MMDFKYGSRANRAVLPKTLGWIGCFLLAAGVCASALQAKEESFKTQIGNVAVGPVKKGNALFVPFITWGGDIATFHANGGLKTAPDSLFAKQGLKLELTPGDNF